MVGLVVGAMVFEEMQVVIDVSDQSSLRASKSMRRCHRAQSLDTIAEFVVDVVGGDHGVFMLGTGEVFDAWRISPLASSKFVQDTGFHSKVFVVWPKRI